MKKKNIIFIFSIIILLFKFNFMIIKIDGVSMEPTYLNSSYRICYKTKEFKRNEVVLVNENNEKIIKRLIGVPGDKILIKDNFVYVNDNLIGGSSLEQVDDKKYYLKENEYFIMGDNYKNSIDSRVFGPILKEDILGIVI